MTDDLVTWLRAQIDEDERVAHAVADHRQRRGELRWTQTDPDRTPGLIGDECGNVVTYDEGRPNEWQAAHIVRHDPYRVLRQVERDRRILDRHASYDFPYNPEDGPGEYSWTGRCDYCHDPWPCPDLRDVAAPYADRPGYRDEWKP